MTKYYYIGTMQEAIDGLMDDNMVLIGDEDSVAPFVNINEEFFLDKKAVKKKYGSLAGMKEVHGAKYVKSVTIDKRVHSRHTNPYMIVNGKRLYLQ